MKNKRGFSLTELIVSVTIFVTVITIVIGGIASMSRTKMLISSMKESQQKTRLLTEMLSRFGKEAIYVSIRSGGTDSNSGNRIDYIFKEPVTNVRSSKVFIFRGTSPEYDSLLYYSCSASALDATRDELLAAVNTNIEAGQNNGSCSKEELLSSQTGLSFKAHRIGAANIFTKRNTIPSTIQLSFDLFNTTSTNSFFDDSIRIDKVLLLESLK